MLKKLLIPLALALSLAGCGMKPRAFGFAMDSCRYVNSQGEVLQMSDAPYIEDDIGYLPREAFLLFSQELPEGEYLPILATAESLGLSLGREGGVFYLSESPEAAMDLDVISDTLGYEISEPQRAKDAYSPGYFVDPYVVYTYEQMLVDIEELAGAYPGLIEAYSFGESEEGRDLMAVELGYGERKVLINASIHGCESFSTSFAMFLIDRYAYAYAVGEEFGGRDCKELLDEVTFVFSVMLNPDGVNIAQNGIAASDNYENVRRMSMKDTGWWGWKTNSNGVDINRNFPFNWWQSNYDRTPGARYYHGPEAASESETRAMMELLETTPYSVFVDLHLYGEYVDWIDSETLYKADLYRPLAEELMDAFGYDDWGVEKVDSFGGYLVNYARNTYDAPAILLELTRFWRCPPRLFDHQTEKLWCLLHILGDYAMEDELKGYSVFLCGEELSDAECREKAVSEDQLILLLDAMGAEYPENISFVSEPIEGEFYALSEEGYIPLNPLFSALGAGCRLSDDGSSLLVEWFR